MNCMRRLTAILMFLLFGSFYAFPSLQTGVQPGTNVITPAQRAKIKKIEGRLMAPCCYKQTILEHDSQVAQEMREEVTAMVISNKSEQEIINYYKTKYGETILVVPDGMSGKIAFAIPVTVFVLSSGLLILMIRRSIRANVMRPGMIPLQISEEDRQQIRMKIYDELGE